MVSKSPIGDVESATLAVFNDVTDWRHWQSSVTLQIGEVGSLQ